MVVIVRLLLLSLVAAQVVALAQQAPLTIHGRVSAADTRAALPRARLTIAVDGEPGSPAYTDDRGEFSIAAPSAASFTLSVVKAGYAAVQIPLHKQALGEAPLRDMAIALTRSAAINGRIVDANGETLVGLRVYADRLDADRSSTAAGLIKFSTTTDDRGEYRIGGLTAGRYSVTTAGAQDPGAVVTLDLRPGDDVSGIGFTALPPRESAINSTPQPRETPELATIRGRVITTAGRPIARALVNITGPMVPRLFVTDTQGRFAFTGLTPGEYEVLASRGDFLPSPVGPQTAFQSSSRIVVTAGARVNDVSLVLSRGLAVTGTIVDRAGEPLQGVSVQALQVSTSGERRLAVLAGALVGGVRQTDDRGQYRVLGLIPGTYLIAASADAASFGGTNDSQSLPIYFPGSASIADAVRVTVTAADVDGIDFAVGDVPTARVTGVALDSSGAPLEGTIQLKVSQRSGIIVPGARMTRTTAGGAFTFFNVAPGDYVVQAVRLPSLPNLQRQQPVLVDFRESVEFAAEYVTVGAHDPEPVSLRTARGSAVEVRIVVESADASESFDRIQIDTHPIESDLAPSSFSMRASGVPFGAGNRRVRLTELIGPWRLVVSGMREGWYLKSVTINGLDVTDRIIDLGASGGTASAEMVVSPKGGSISGRVSTEGRAARANSVVVFPVDREKWFERSRFVKVTRVAQEGSFRATSLPPGDYYVSATAILAESGATPEALEQLVPRAERVTLDEGEERRVEMSR